MPVQRGSFRVVAVMTRKWERLPAPTEGVVSRQLGEEFVVLSTARDEAHSLSGPSAVVWRSVRDGTRPALPDQEIDTAVEALLDLGLLARPVGLSRRRVLQGGVVVTAVGISTIALPTVAAAASGLQSYGTRGSGALNLIEEFPGATLILPVNARNIVVTLAGAPGGDGGAGSGIPTQRALFGDGAVVTWTLGTTLLSALTLAYTVGQPGGAATGTFERFGGPAGSGFEVGGGGATSGEGGTAQIGGGGGGGGGSTGVVASGAFSGPVIAGGGGGGGGRGSGLVVSGLGGAGGNGGNGGTAIGGHGGNASGGGAGGLGGGQTGNTTPGNPATAGTAPSQIFDGAGGGGGGGFIGGEGGVGATAPNPTDAEGGGGGGAGGSTPATSLPVGGATYGVAPLPDAFIRVTYLGGPATGTGIIP